MKKSIAKNLESVWFGKSAKTYERKTPKEVVKEHYAKRPKRMGDGSSISWQGEKGREGDRFYPLTTFEESLSEFEKRIENGNRGIPGGWRIYFDPKKKKHFAFSYYNSM
jgi:hypothetical protein